MPDNNAAGPVAHVDTTAKWFLLSAICYFFIVGIIALTIAAKFCWPEILGTVPAEMNRRNRHVGQQRQRVGQRVFVGRIAHGDDGPVPRQPSRSGHATAEVAQPHDRRPSAAIVHRFSKPNATAGGKRCEARPPTEARGQADVFPND